MQFSTNRKPRKLVCSDCGASRRVGVCELKRSARPRCRLCGGPLNEPVHVNRQRSQRGRGSRT